LPPYYYDVVLSAFQEEVDKHLNRNRMVQGKIFEIQQYHKDGSLIWVEVSIKAVTDENNDSSSVKLAGNVRLTGSVRLIEQRKVIELALKESEEKYALITNAVKDIIAMIDVKTLRFVFIAGAVNDLTGFTSAEYLNMTLNDVVTPESFEIIRETIAFGLKNYYEGKVNAPEAMMEVQQYHKNGSIIWMEVSAKMTMEDGKPDKIISVIRRIDDRKKMELELKESEERYRFVTDNQKDFIWIINLHTLKYEFVAGAFYEILSYTFDEFL
jgi:PAS domain S-box-containing protein